MIFITVSLAMFYHMLKRPFIDIMNCVSLFALFCIYIIVSSVMQYNRGLKEAKELKKKNELEENKGKQQK